MAPRLHQLVERPDPGELPGRALVYLRTAVSVDPKGWAKFDYVKMPEYRWGVLLAPQVEDRASPAASTPANRPGRKCRANTATCSSG
jgi:hypothetical protein